MIITEVNAEGYLGQLAEEIVGAYAGGEDTPTNHITGLLAFQRITPVITKGTIDPTDLRTVNITTEPTILNALLTLRGSIGGYVDVDDSRVLTWLNDIGEDKGQQIRYKKNLQAIEKQIDWHRFCTKLHPEGAGGIKLSDLDVVSEAVTKSSDASYGYLTLSTLYSLYKDWTALGDNLPAHITVYRSGAEADIIPTGTSDPDAGWNDEAKARDNDTGTYAYSNAVISGQRTEYLIFSKASAVWMTGVKFMASQIGATYGFVNSYVDVSVNGTDWDNIWNSALEDGDNGNWLQGNFAAQLVKYIRVRFLRLLGSADHIHLHELRGVSTYFDDTSDFEQGSNERIVRCAIADYYAGDTYTMSYTRANYLIAWDKIATYGAVSGKMVNTYINDAETLLEAARLYLTDMKDPPTSYTISTLDLSEVDANFSFDALQLGSIVTVIDEELNIDVSTRVMKIVHPDLLQPEKMEIELSTRARNISDYIVELYQQFE